MDYISVKEASRLWGIDTSNIGKLCRKGKIEGAKIVGRNWLIPKNAPKPIDGRTRAAKKKKAETVFRFPLYVNFPEDHFLPPLSNEESKLRQAQVDYNNCEFDHAKVVFEELSENAESIYVKICAHFYLCVLSAEYDIDINWEKHYYDMNLLLSKDFPRKKEMELFLSWFDCIIGQLGKIPEKLNTDSAYEYHPTALYMNALLSSIGNFGEMNVQITNARCTEPFDSLCRIMERDGYYVEAQGLHFLLFSYHFNECNEEAMDYHLRKAVKLAFDHNLLVTVADAETYYSDVINKVLCEYPYAFAERIRKYGKIIFENFSRFAMEVINTDVYNKLSKSDFRYVFYAVKGYPNKQVASLCGVSMRTVAKRYNEIYEKLGINSKQELINQMNSALGK